MEHFSKGLGLGGGYGKGGRYGGGGGGLGGRFRKKQLQRARGGSRERRERDRGEHGAWRLTEASRMSQRKDNHAAEGSRASHACAHPVPSIFK
jgi:hypothetical protein